MSALLDHPSSVDVPPFGAHGTLDDVPALADRLAQRLAATAAERDRIGGHAARERELIRDSGLLALSIEREHGGWGAELPLLYAVVRRLAEADAALAHVFAFHHLQVATVRLYGSAEQNRRLLRETIEHGWFWGNALNPLDKRLVAVRDAARGGFVLSGVKSYCSGSVGSDRLMLSAWCEASPQVRAAPSPPPAGGEKTWGGPAFPHESGRESGSLVIGSVPTAAEGVAVRGDWEAFGQRQTDSGTVSFENVWLPDADVLQAPGHASGSVPGVRATLRPLVAQLVLVNLYAGIAQGAFDAARRFTQEQARPWFTSGVQQAVADPYVQHRYGELSVHLRAAHLLADDAARQLAHAIRLGADATPQQRGEAAVAVAQAKVAAHRAGLAITSDLFELNGARATSEKLALDRYWRNLRVHTLHDPIDYKLRDLGRFALEGRVPEPTPYS